MSYTSAERYTTLNCDDETKLWCASSLQQSFISKMKKAGFEPYKIDSDGTHWFRDIPFNCISVRSVSTKKRKPISDEHKRKMQEGKKRNGQK